MTYPFVTVDVFTDTPFGGNPLAVITDAVGLSDEDMQRIAFEFNFSESTFVLPPEDPANTARVRIFTPCEELPFAGHPNVGTAYVLARAGKVFGQPIGDLLRFEELAGVVPVEILKDSNGALEGARLTAPTALDLGQEFDPGEIAACLSLAADDLTITNHRPRVASVGLPFIMAEAANQTVVARARADTAAFAQYFQKDEAEGIQIYVASAADNGTVVSVHTRVFAPVQGIEEDPATGSANAALSGLIASIQPGDDTLHLEITQGVEMGRPSRLLGEVDKKDGEVTAIRIAGACREITRGELTVFG